MDTKNSEKFFSYLETLHQKYSEISNQLSSPDITGNRKKFARLSKEISGLKPLEDSYQEYKDLLKQLNESKDILENSDDDEMRSLADDEIKSLETKIEMLEDGIKVLMVSDITEDCRNVFLEIRAGAGGNEASLFASDLLRMYTRISEINGWKAEIISTNYSGIGGIKEITIYIKGDDVNKYLKFESGVHRVQRIPQTESSGRIHTSTVTVAVLPEVEDIEIEINPKDIRIDTYRASGAGGQHVNKTESAIRITHFPTNIVVSCQDESSQHKNKDRAMKVLKSRLYEVEMERQQDHIANDRKSKVGKGDRSEKIRTYNFPQSRVTDHRINGRNFNIESILDGNIESLVKELKEINSKQLLTEKFEEIIN